MCLLVHSRAGGLFWKHNYAMLAPDMSLVAGSEAGDELLITACEASSARSIGAAIHHLYGGELDYHSSDDGGILRIHWKR
jgi:hypothetical protein